MASCMNCCRYFAAIPGPQFRLRPLVSAANADPQRCQIRQNVQWLCRKLYQHNGLWSARIARDVSLAELATIGNFCSSYNRLSIHQVGSSPVVLFSLFQLGTNPAPHTATECRLPVSYSGSALKSNVMSRVSNPSIRRRFAASMNRPWPFNVRPRFEYPGSSGAPLSYSISPFSMS